MDSPDVPSWLLRLPEELLSRFPMEQWLGRGAMGAVYRSTHTTTGRAVAVKVMTTTGDPDLVERMMREGRALSRVPHPHLVEVFDLGESGGLPWLVMELIEGRTWDQYHLGSPDPVAMAEHTLQVAEGLQAMHDADLVHRDVKAPNLMVDQGGRAVVMDLGLVRDEEVTRITQSRCLVGTVSHMAPEVLSGAEIAPSTDWYALGVTLHSLLAGQLPYGPAQVIASLATGEPLTPPPLPQALATTPVARLALRLLEFHPANRPGSAVEIRAILAADRRRQPSPRGESSSSGLEASKLVPRPESGASREPRRPPWRTRAGLLVGLGVLALCVTWITETRLGSNPASAPVSEPGPSVHSRPPADTDTLAADLVALGFSPGKPLLDVEVLARAPEGVPPDRLERLFTEVAPDTAAEFLRFKLLGSIGDHSGRDASARLPEEWSAPRDFWAARLAVEVLGHRLERLGPRAAAHSPVDRARLRRAIEDLEGWLREQPDLDLQVVRVELWAMLASRLASRPGFNLPAAERTIDLLGPLLPRARELSPSARAALLLGASGVLRSLGDFERLELVHEFLALEVLDEVTDPVLRARWEKLFLFDLSQRQAAGQVLSPERLFTPDRDTWWLPSPALPGGTIQGARSWAMIPNPPRRGILEIRVEEAGGPIASVSGLSLEARMAIGSRLSGGELEGWLQRVLTTARLFDLRVRPTPEAIDRFFPSTALRARGATREAVLGLPGVLVAYENGLERGEEPALAQELLREADRRVRTSYGYLADRRRWYRDDWAALSAAHLRREVQADPFGKGRARVASYLRRGRFLPGPWTVGEVESHFQLWTALAESLDEVAPCRPAHQEAFRLGLRLAEYIAVHGAQGELQREKVLRSTLREWVAGGWAHAEDRKRVQDALLEADLHVLLDLLPREDPIPATGRCALQGDGLGSWMKDSSTEIVQEASTKRLVEVIHALPGR